MAMQIRINNITSYRSPESLSFTPDDRVERVELINGNCVQDYGHIASGDQFTVSALFSWTDFTAIVALWESRTPVTFTDDGGVVWQGMRIVLRGYTYEARFPNYVNVKMELWRV
jgi:hypothetical protein